MVLPSQACLKRVSVLKEKYRVSITSGDLIAGRLPATTLKEVRRWLDHNLELAMDMWKERNPSK